MKPKLFGYGASVSPWFHVQGFHLFWVPSLVGFLLTSLQNQPKGGTRKSQTHVLALLNLLNVTGHSGVLGFAPPISNHTHRWADMVGLRPVRLPSGFRPDDFDVTQVVLGLAGA